MWDRPFTGAGWRVTSPYGWRRHPVTGEWTRHTGIDLVKAHRHPIRPFVPGTVVHTGQNASGTRGFGLVVLVQDAGGYLHMYAHLDEIATATGRRVAADSLLGYQGATGIATGSHLHYEVRREPYPNWGWQTDLDPGIYVTAWTGNTAEEGPTMSAEEWQREMGVEALERLAERGLVQRPDDWADNLGAPIPAWLFWTMLERITDGRATED